MVCLSIEENKKLVSVMIEKYCKNNHKEKDTCSECRGLQDYALKKLESCPWGEDKPVCSNCPIHCYDSEMRSKIQEVMRYSGPRAILYSPYLSIKYLIQKLRYKPSMADFREIKKKKIVRE